MIKVCEYVSFGHPDKIADQISDALLDAYLKDDPNSRCGIETMVKDNTVVLGGEVNSKSVVNCREIAKEVIASIGFPQNHNLFKDNIKVINLIGQQSEEIHNGVDKTNEEIGAGDQGLMYGYATNETPNYMPLGSYIAKKICDYVAIMDGLGPDVKTQVIIDYKDNGDVDVKSILVSTMHLTDYPLGEVRDNVELAIRMNAMKFNQNIFEKLILIPIEVNPCGSWNIGGPVSDCGVTGRKLVVDNYGSYCEIGGGAYSGKDMTKVDRSAAYMARYLAKNIVASGICNKAKVSLSYMIGVAKPCSVCVETDKEEINDKLIDFILNNVNITPKGIIDRFNGTTPQYFYTAKYGHYGNDVCPWEKLDLVDEIRKIF